MLSSAMQEEKKNSPAMSLDFLTPTNPLRRLFLLLALKEQSDVSQEKLSRRIGLSRSMTHNYIRDLIGEGLLRMEGETNRQIRYFLTAKGIRETGRLFHRYSDEIVCLYAVARTEFEKRLLELGRKGIGKVVLFGAADTGELVYNAIQNTDIEVVGVVDNDPRKQNLPFGLLRVLPPSEIARLKPDAVIITAMGRPDEIYDQIKHLEEKGIDVVRL